MHYFSRIIFFASPIFFACSLPVTNASSALSTPEGLSATFAEDLKKLQEENEKLKKKPRNKKNKDDL